MSPETTIRDRLLERTFDSSWPFAVVARLCDLRPRFIPKGRIGRGHRAISRNGHVLLASDRPLTELVGTLVHLRLQTWHKTILPNDPPEPYGILLCAHAIPDAEDQPIYETRLVSTAEGAFDFALDVGGGRRLAFQHAKA
jgi:hypothetical protein